MKRVFQLLAVISLAVCVWAPVRHFLGEITADAYKDVFLAGTVGWFVFATAAMIRGKQK